MCCASCLPNVSTLSWTRIFCGLYEMTLCDGAGETDASE